MNIYNAILRAADHIEQHPNDFHFMTGSIPKAPECGTPGCALGWIGFFSGCVVRKEQSDFVKVAAELGVVNPRWPERPDLEFYEMLESSLSPHDREEWKHNARICAKGLRLYAEKYHGHEKPKPVAPDWKAMSAKWTVGDDVKSQELVS